MPRRVLVTRSEQSFDLIEAPAPSEHHLQEVVKTSPQLIPADDLGLDGDLLVVGRETSLASGYIDLLCLARSGDLVLVEFKTGPQNPDFRHALAQAIDYGSDLWRLSVEDFDRGVVQRYLAGGRVDAAFRGARTLSEAIERTSWDLTSDDRTALFERLTEVLQTGDFAFVIAAQRFTDSMKNSLDYPISEAAMTGSKLSRAESCTGRLSMDLGDLGDFEPHPFRTLPHLHRLAV